MHRVNLLNKPGIQKKDTKDISIIFKEKSISHNQIDKIENYTSDLKVDFKHILLSIITLTKLIAPPIIIPPPWPLVAILSLITAFLRVSTLSFDRTSSVKTALVSFSVISFNLLGRHARLVDV